MDRKRLWTPLWFFSLSLFLLLIVLPLTRQGMFLDGVIYAAIAKNLALGQGSLWHPFYSKTTFPVFYEHPPLALYLQSLFFRILGKGFGVEQAYCLLMAFGQFALIAYYWVKKEKTPFYSLALLLLLWLLAPLNLKYVNNHLEATLTLFTTFATLLLLIKTKSRINFIIQYVSAAAVILIAFFCNGPTAFFPLAVPLIQALLDKPIAWYDGIKNTIFFALLLAILLSIFYLLVPDALINTQHYLNEQLLPSTTGSRQLNLIGFYHLYVFNLYFRAYWLLAVFALACMTIAAKMKDLSIGALLVQHLKNKNFLLFFLLSLVSSLPIAVSHRQALNYIMQSAPFFTLAMMYLCYEPVQIIINYCASKPWLLKASFYLNLFLFITSLVTVFSLANGFNAHQAMITDINKIIDYCKNDAILSTSPVIYEDWHAGAYFARNSMMSLTPEKDNRYYLGLKNETIAENYHLINLPLSYYQLAKQD